MTSFNLRDNKLPEIPAAWLVRITLLILALAGIFALMLLRTEVLLIVLAGVFLGIAIKPVVKKISGNVIPKRLAASLIIVSILVIFALMVGFGLPLLADQFIELGNFFSETYTDLRIAMSRVQNVLVKQLVQTMPVTLFEFGEAQVEADEDENSMELEGFRSLSGQVFSGILGILFVAFLAINWAIEGDRYIQSAILLSNQPREYMRETFGRVEEQLTSYLSGLGILTLIIGVASFLGYLLIGLPYALLLGIFAGLMEAVPMVGPTLGAIPAVIVAFSISPGKAIAVIVLTILIQVVENNWLVPWVMGKSTGVSPFITLISLIAFSTLFGIGGALLAIPIAAVSKGIFESVKEYRRKQSGEEIGRDRFGALRYELKRLIEDFPLHKITKDEDGKVENLEDELEAIALDLDALLQKPVGEYGDE